MRPRHRPRRARNTWVNSLLLSQTFFVVLFLVAPNPFFRAPLLTADQSVCRASVLRGHVEDPHFHPDALAVMRYERFGNNLVQFIRALLICDVIKVRTVYVEPGFLFFNESFVTTRGVTVHPFDPPPEKVLLRGTFFFMIPGEECLTWDPLGITATFKSYVIRHLPLEVANLSCIYAHVRSGDIFTHNIHPLYGQPPCHYYLEAIEMDGDGHSCVCLIAEDLLNPCGEVLIRTGAQWSKRPMLQDFAILVASKRIILSKGSFGLSVLYLSPYPKTYYAFTYGWPGLGRHMCCEPTQEYQDKLLARWEATDEQKALMLTSKCRVWWEVPE
jgi:hypothetical protein